MKNKQRILLNGIGIVLFIPVFLLTLQASFLEQTPVQFTSEEDVKLLGTFYPGDQPAGVILLEGFGSDQVNMTSLLIEFQQAGFNVFTFDFSGHGRSDGTLGFDNAQTDTQARQLIQAMDEFKNQTGLENSQLVLLGHSLGARVALQAAGMLDHPLLPD